MKKNIYLTVFVFEIFKNIKTHYYETWDNFVNFTYFIKYAFTTTYNNFI